MCSGSQLFARNVAAGPGAAAANLRRGHAGASCLLRALGRFSDSDAAAYLPPDRQHSAAAGGLHASHGPRQHGQHVKPGGSVGAAAASGAAPSASAPAAFGAAKQHLLHGSGTAGADAATLSNSLHVLSPLHDGVDASMLLHEAQPTGPGCNGIDPVCQLDLRCDPVDTLQQLRCCLNTHGSAMLLVQDGRPNLLLDAVGLLHLLNQDLRLEEDYSSIILFQPLLSSDLDLAAQGVHAASHAAAGTFHAPSGSHAAAAPGSFSAASGSFHPGPQGGVTASGNGGIRVDSSSMALRVTKLRAPGLLQQCPKSCVAYCPPGPPSASSPRHASPTHANTSARGGGGAHASQDQAQGKGLSRGQGRGGGRASPYASIPRSSTMDEVWGITDQIVAQLETNAVTQLRCMSPRSLVVAFRAIKRARKLLQLAGDWDLLVSPHIINDKVCFNCWRSKAGSLEWQGHSSHSHGHHAGHQMHGSGRLSLHSGYEA